jgi:hypothetical protein
MKRENLMNALSRVGARTNVFKVMAVLAAGAVLSACSGGGAGTQENPITSAPPVQNYSGPPAANADTQAFAVELWDKIKPNNRCGQCHNAGGQSPQFARNDDVNLAYQAANTVVNLAQPDQSRMVIKVAGGHNCWLASPQACADTLTVWIRNWAGAAATGGRQIQLQDPPIREVGQSKSFPSDAEGASRYATTIYPVVRPAAPLQYCQRCHSPDAATSQAPFFASSDSLEAYLAAKSKINLDNPAASRLVVRLRDEAHNCWSDCASNAATMLAAVTAFANTINPTEVNPNLVISKALRLFDGTVAAGGNRYDNNVIALWEFKSRDQTDLNVYDTSGVEPAINMTRSAGTTEWAGGWGLVVKAGGKAQGPTTTSKKLSDLIKSTGEYSVEAWVAPANVAQEDAYIISYSAGAMARNFTLAQREYQYEALVRSSVTNANGGPSFLTRDADRDAQATLQHVVLTYDPVNGRRLYVNGMSTGDTDAAGGGTLSDWDDSFALVFGNETSNNRQWQGVLKLVAVHNRALTLAQIQQNFAAGVGERYFLLFSVSDLIGMPRSYLMLEGTQLDSYGYQFTKPTFISLDPNAQIPNIPLQGLRIGVNGAEATVGQAYIPLNTTISATNYQAGSGQLLSTIGTVIGAEKGPDADEFFISFDQIGSRTIPPNARNEPTFPDDEPLPQGDPKSDIGVRTFEEINASMSAITGVPATRTAVADTYNLVKQQLPTVESIDAFLASHQTGIAQLAIQYCDELVNDATLRNQFFGSSPAIDINATGAYFSGSQANRDVVINALLAKAVGSDIASQPEEYTMGAIPGTRDNLNQLMIDLANNGLATTGRAGTVTKGACAAVLGSAALLVQ